MPARAVSLVVLACLSALTLRVANAQALITGLSDIDLGTWYGSGDLNGEDDHCVYAAQGGQFAVSASGEGPGGGFVLTGAAGSLPFDVSYADDRNSASLQPNVWVGGFRGSPNLNQLNRCLSGSRTPETIEIRIGAAALSAAPAGRYRGVLTLVVAPE
jgi:hypothetical protein